MRKAGIPGEKPVVFVPPAPVVYYWILPLNLVQNAWRELLIDVFVDQFSNERRSFRGTRIEPVAKEVQFAKAFLRESLRPWDQLFCDVLLHDEEHFALLLFLIEPSRLVNECQNANLSEAAHQRICGLDHMLLHRTLLPGILQS